ncbi:cell envelope integrity protein TolA [Marilutibacter chinensis]|uniref:Cell envelope integrity protein TolA n=1 Tax=Marilutibacter chinensis TaxID=2912247 RepID=A0ABS9HUJ4_9GAMM|nr:cell envelope integrity protein TolA [Lysobacter chinensis]MCF7221988.1 cell envelope integrity protein TolA [Lysobacter chinensis]
MKRLPRPTRALPPGTAPAPTPALMLALLLASWPFAAAAEGPVPDPAVSDAGGLDDALMARYGDALRDAVVAHWIRPQSVSPGARCMLLVRQLPGGDVVSAEVSSPCDYDEAGRASIEAAVYKAQPLPYAGFETVFQRQLLLNFEARDR